MSLKDIDWGPLPVISCGCARRQPVWARHARSRSPSQQSAGISKVSRPGSALPCSRDGNTASIRRMSHTTSCRMSKPWEWRPTRSCAPPGSSQRRARHGAPDGKRGGGRRSVAADPCKLSLRASRHRHRARALQSERGLAQARSRHRRAHGATAAIRPGRPPDRANAGLALRPSDLRGATPVAAHDRGPDAAIPSSATTALPGRRALPKSELLRSRAISSACEPIPTWRSSRHYARATASAAAKTRWRGKDRNLIQVMPDVIRFDLPIWLVMHEDLRSSRPGSRAL